MVVDFVLLITFAIYSFSLLHFLRYQPKVHKKCLKKGKNISKGHCKLKVEDKVADYAINKCTAALRAQDTYVTLLCI